MPIEPAVFLANWYAEQCDGDWEHGNGIRITTLDNPGWSVRINLAETDLEGVVLERENTEEPDGRWTIVSSDGLTFQAAGDERSLPALMARFQQFHDQAVREGKLTT